MLKVFAGVISLFVHTNEYISNDVTYYHQLSLKELSLLSSSPKAFFNEWLLNWGQVDGRWNFFQKNNMVFWNNLGTLFHIKFMTLSNIFSGGRLYVNIIFYNVCFFVGQLALYKTFYQLQPQKKIFFLVVIFLVPSVLFWCSGIHKDGWLLSAFGLLCYFTQQYLQTKKVKDLFLIIFILGFVFIARYFYFLCLLPPYFLWIFARNVRHKFIVFLTTYLLACVLFFTVKYISPSLDPMQLIVNRQTEFINLRGYSDMKMPRLKNDYESFRDVFPIAMNHIILKPSLEVNSPLKYKISFLDALLVLGIIIITSINVKRKNLQNGFLLFLLFYSLSIYLFIGYTVPNAGALVRYKSVFTALLLPTLVALSEISWLSQVWKRMGEWRLFRSE